MNFDPTTYKLVRAWLRAHVHFDREIIRRLQSVSSEMIGQPFNNDDIEYLVTNDGIGYEVQLEADPSKGLMKFHGIPGRFVASTAGAIWKAEKTRLHSEIERRCDQKEGLVIIQ